MHCISFFINKVERSLHLGMEWCAKKQSSKWLLNTCSQQIPVYVLHVKFLSLSHLFSLTFKVSFMFSARHHLDPLTCCRSKKEEFCWVLRELNCWTTSHCFRKLSKLDLKTWEKVTLVCPVVNCQSLVILEGKKMCTQCHLAWYHEGF